MYELIPVSQIRPSPTNPRKTFHKLEELAASFGEVGVLEPIMVRPLPPDEANGITHELVFGERRWRAANLAGLATLPASVRELTDKQVLEIQIIENDKREDVHPLEQADGYRALHETHGYSVEDLAVKVGRSAAFIRSRMKLCTLIPEARTALVDEKILPSVAVLLARIPDPGLQRKALEELLPADRKATGGYYADTRLATAAEASAIIRQQFMLRLEDAPFDRADAGLVPTAGACTSCPKRTGAQSELFADIDSPDLCTDMHCHRSKVDAQWKLLQIRSKETGQKLLSEKETKSVFQHGSERPAYGSNYVAATEKEWQSGKQKTIKQILGKEAPEPILAKTESGQIVELYPKKLVHQIVDRNAPSSDTMNNDAYKAAEAKRRNEAEVARMEKLAVAVAIVAKASAQQPKDEVIRLIIEAFAFDRSWAMDSIVKARELDVSKDKTISGREARAIAKLAGELKDRELFGLLVELATNVASDSIKDRIAALYKVDAKTVATNARTEVKAAQKERAAKKKAKAKPAAAKKPAAKKPAAKAKKKPA
jgi:ParB/RepB/Spo0J family partition protein